jgi:Family of unknown function (DUF6395)
MRVFWTTSGGEWTLRLRLDADESLVGPGQGGAPVKLVTNSCLVRLPTPAVEPHPDLRALAALLIVRPWVGSRLTFDRPISPAFAGMLRNVFQIDGEPVDGALPARTPGPQLALSYSSGVDSIAASELLDATIPYLHHQRIKHPRMPNRANHIRADQIAKLVRAAGERERQVIIAESDHEYLCLPWPQFPSWPSVMVAGVLLADELDLGGLAFGTVLESVYLAGGRRYNAGAGRPGEWSTALVTAGLPLCRPVAGLTEVGTFRLALESGLRDLAQSCLLGYAGRPCLGCVKCVRKELLAAAVSNKPVHPKVRTRLQPDDPIAKEFQGSPPLHMQNIAEYILARVRDVEGTLLETLTTRVAATVESTSWNERYYPRALVEQVPERWRADISAGLAKRLDPMTEEDTQTVESWDGARRMRD